MTELSDLNHYFWDIPKFIDESVRGFNPLNKGFFIEYIDNAKQCYKCRELFNVFHKTNKHLWCPWCFVKHHCTLYRDDDKIIITLKYSGKEIFYFTQIKNYQELLDDNKDIPNYNTFSNSFNDHF